MQTPSSYHRNASIKETDYASKINMGSSRVSGKVSLNGNTNCYDHQHHESVSTTTTTLPDKRYDEWGTIVTPPLTPLLLLLSPPQMVAETSFNTSCHNETITDLQEAIVLHEDFTKLLSLSPMAKYRRHLGNQVNSDGNASLSCSSSMPTTAMNVGFGSNKHIVTVQIIKERLTSKMNSFERCSNHVIRRGQYQTLDSFVDQSIVKLEQKMQFSQPPQSDNVMPVARGGCNEPRVQEDCHKDQGKLDHDNTQKGTDNNHKEAIVTKYPKYQIDILMKWMIDHKTNPCPNMKQIEWLAQRTGLNASQIINWTTNVRKRNIKATCKGNKKPHHFIDFLFLAQTQQQQLETSLSTTETTNSNSGTNSKSATLQKTRRCRYRKKKELASSFSSLASSKTSSEVSTTLTNPKRKRRESQRIQKKKRAKTKCSSYHGSDESYLYAELHDNDNEVPLSHVYRYDDETMSMPIFCDRLWDSREDEKRLYGSSLDGLMIKDDGTGHGRTNVDYGKDDEFVLRKGSNCRAAFKKTSMCGDVHVYETIKGHDLLDDESFFGYDPELIAEYDLLTDEPFFGDSDDLELIAEHGFDDESCCEDPKGSIWMKLSTSTLTYVSDGINSFERKTGQQMLTMPISTLQSSSHSRSYSSIVVDDYQMDDYDNPIDPNEPIDDIVLEDFVRRYNQVNGE